MVASSPPLAAPTGISPLPTGASAEVTLPVRVIVKLRNRPGQGSASAMSLPGGSAASAVAATPEMKLQELVTRHAARSAAPLSPGHSRARQQQAAGFGARSKMAPIQPKFPARAARAPANATPPDLSATYVLDLGQRTTKEVAATIQSLRADPAVLYAEEDKVARACYVPNDPSYSSTGSWGQGYDDLHGLKRIDTTAAWDVTRGQGVVVAVIDTGIDYNHPDISANIWLNPGEIPGNGLDDDHNGFIDDVRGWDFVGTNHTSPSEDNDPYDGNFHGTHVAGTIAATGDNGLGVVGVAWQAKVMAIKGLDDSGTGNDSDLARAIIYAVDNGADVINASWGEVGAASVLADAIDYAHTQGVVFVAAAGNDSIDANTFSPANVPAAMAVSSLDPEDRLSTFSNFGSKIDLAAPGGEILSLQNGTSGYTRHSGTSMAAPHVSGVAALVLAQHPAYSVEQVRQTLRVSATDLGPAGRDSSFGYGRVNAAQALLVSEPLEARIFSPRQGTTIAGVTSLMGTAGGPAFDHYIVDYAADESPAAWVTIRNSSLSVTNGDIGTFDATSLPDGSFTVRLRVFDSGGTVFGDEVRIEVRYLAITSPAPPKVPSITRQLKPGVAYAVTGSAQGPSFQEYRLEWAPGVAATTGWSSTGFALTGNGLAPVVDGTLGSWTPPTTPAGYYTLRLTVTNTGFSSTAITTVHLEPALISGGWPKLIAGAAKGPTPARLADGTSRLVMNDTTEPRLVHAYAPDGSRITATLETGTMVPPAAADLDGLPGDEIVVAAGEALQIFSADLTLIRSIPAGGRWFFGLQQQVTLVDLDNDGVLEIVTCAMNQDASAIEGEIRAYRVDGTPFFSTPPALVSRWAWDVDVKMVAVDLDGDGQKEIVAAFDNPDGLSYRVTVFRADGTAYPGWGPLTFPAVLHSFEAADLDRDGTWELIINEYPQAGSINRIRVLNHNGETRSGWPVQVTTYSGITRTAIGDLDRDGQSEIVVVSDSVISVFRADGGTWGEPWTIEVQGSFAETPLIADIDDDGLPEIIVAQSTYQAVDGFGPFNACVLVSFHADGTGRQSWPVFGLDGRQPFRATPLVGDFNGDGQTDLVASLTVLDGGGSSGMLPITHTALTWLTTGTPFNGAASDWTGNLHDARNSRTLDVNPPAITVQPFARSVTAGQGTTFRVAVMSTLPLQFQWQRKTAAGVWTDLPGGGDCAGTATSTLSLTAATSVMSGDQFRCRVDNSMGSITSNPATLTVLPGLADWLLAKFSAEERADPAISGPNADPDHDGFVNLLEYALGLEPQAASTSGLPEVGTLGSDWVYTYTRPSDRTELTYEVEASTDLVNWTAAGVTHERVSAPGGNETWRGRRPLAGAAHCFFRLKITQP